MCSPSRATLLTGKYPSRHGVTLTMTEGDLFPDARNLPAVLRTVGAPRGERRSSAERLARGFFRSFLRLGPKSGNEPELPSGIDTLATLLRERGYHVAIKGKWHLSSRVRGGWSAGGRRAHRARLRVRRLGAAGRGRRREGGDVRRRQRRHDGQAGTRTTPARWKVARPGGLPEPFCLVFSLVNPHDVLGYPSSYERGGYSAGQFRGLGVPLPPTPR